MQLVIDISEDDYRKVQDGRASVSMMRKTIRNGTLLPKGHGRLIDADKTLKKHCAELCREKPSCHEDCLIYDLFHLAPTIIEADEAESEGKE